MCVIFAPVTWQVEHKQRNLWEFSKHIWGGHLRSTNPSPAPESESDCSNRHGQCCHCMFSNTICLQAACLSSNPGVKAAFGVTWRVQIKTPFVQHVFKSSSLKTGCLVLAHITALGVTGLLAVQHLLPGTLYDPGLSKTVMWACR